MRLLVLLGLLAAGCSTSPARPPAPPPDASLALADTASGPVSRPIPTVALREGRSDTLVVADLTGTDAAVTFPAHPGAEADRLGGGRVVLRAGDGLPVVVPFEVGGVRYVVALGHPPDLTLRLQGADSADPSLLVFVAQARDGSPVDLDDEDGVALSGNRLLEENALDVYADRLVLDLDALGPGRRRLRVVAAPPGAVSNWVEVTVEGGRVVPAL